MSPSALVFYLGVSGRVAGLRHHNLFFDESLDDHAHDIYTGEHTRPQYRAELVCVAK
jgi:phytoene dehydrogenase-like protein